MLNIQTGLPRCVKHIYLKGASDVDCITFGARKREVRNETV